MAERTIATRALDDDRLHERLERRIDATLARAQAGGVSVLASVTTCVGAGDPSAIVLDLRRPNDPWFCFEQPERGGFALAGVGCACAVQADGPERFSEVARRWRQLSAASLSDPSVGVPGSGLTAVGGFAFADHGCASIKWSEFAAASLLVPELSLARSEEQTWLTLNAQVAPDDTRQDVLARLHARFDRLRPSTLPIGDPLPAAPHRVVSAISPAHYEAAVASAVKRIRTGELEKIVLAREVEVEASMTFDPAPIFGLLRDAFSSSFVYAVGRGDSTFIGATPELLVRREGQRVTTVALAGSARRSADPAVDDHLSEKLLHSAKDREENAIVARRITRALRARSMWVVAADQPTVIRVANIQHLATPIRAQLSAPVGAIELAEILHPTPAVGAEPASALDSIPALEGIDRGWYAGPVGWTDTSGDGEFCVALRCALLRGRHAYCYAGCGIVADSDPASELAESEMKLQVMVPALIA